MIMATNDISIEQSLRNILYSLIENDGGVITTKTLNKRDKAIEAILATVSKHLPEKQLIESHFQIIVPNEGPRENANGSFADGYAKAIEDVCNAHYIAINGHGEMEKTLGADHE